ncbi:MAG: hypothetical protein GXO31_09335 [Epsilonproteobacteria bacterium]|nr:hypothetical protein [Campylobacterota bacterium]
MPQNSNSKRYKFETRFEASLQLLDILPAERMKEENWFILATSKNALPIAAFLANRLELDFDIIFIEPIFAPSNPECAIGMVSESEDIVSHAELVDSFEITMDYIYGEAHRRYEEDIISDIYTYKGTYNLKEKIKNREVLLVDDGCESGLTMFTAIKSLINNQAKSVKIAVPIIPREVYRSFLPKTDEIYYVHIIDDFIETSFYYKEYNEVTQESVKEILNNRENREKEKM